MVVNKTMFDEAGIEVPTEWTYDEFLDVCAKLTHGEGSDKVYGVFWNSQQDMAQYAQFMIQQTLGGDNMYNADGTALSLIHICQHHIRQFPLHDFQRLLSIRSLSDDGIAVFFPVQK